MTVVVHEPTVTESTVECAITPSRDVRRFFAGDTFRAEYDTDLTGVTPAIATVPVLAHVCPVAWANGADVEVPVVDGTFLDALREVRDVLGRMYPEFIEGGEVRAAEVVDARATRSPDHYDDVALLFSGGVDSIASYLRHRDEEPTLVSVQGWVIGVDEDDRWEGAKHNIERFAANHGLENRIVRSNALSFLDEPMLQAHYKRYLVGSWYSSVGHGLGLLGLCAPVSENLGLGTIYIASTHTKEFSHPWGSHPTIDDNIGWACTRCHHDGYELGRQDKLELIAGYVDAEDQAVQLRTCLYSESGTNCNECEKCYRTMCGLVLAGEHPEKFGYEMAPETFDEIREWIEQRDLIMDQHIKFQWEDLQNNIRLDRGFPLDGATEFFEWLADVDMAAVAATANTPTRRRVVRAVTRNVPYPVYASLYPVYDTLKDELSSRSL